MRNRSGAACCRSRTVRGQANGAMVASKHRRCCCCAGEETAEPAVVEGTAPEPAVIETTPKAGRTGCC